MWCKTRLKNTSTWDKDTLNYNNMTILFISTYLQMIVPGAVTSLSSTQRIPLVEMTVGGKRDSLLFTGTLEVIVGLHTNFALLYLRGGLCWDWGLACRRSTAIFTSENKSIQTLNITVTIKQFLFTQSGSTAATLPPSKNEIQKSELDESPKCGESSFRIGRIEFRVSEKQNDLFYAQTKRKLDFELENFALRRKALDRSDAL